VVGIYKNSRDAAADLRQCSPDYLIKKYYLYSGENTHPEGVKIFRMIRDLMTQRKLLRGDKVMHPYLPIPKNKKHENLARELVAQLLQ
jgi:hypothetical protein